MPIRWYVSELSGKGTWDDPIHAAAWDATDPEKNELIGFKHGDKYIVRVNSDEATHAKIVIEEKGVALSDSFDNEEQESAALSSIVESQECALLSKNQKDWIENQQWKSDLEIG